MGGVCDEVELFKGSDPQQVFVLRAKDYRARHLFTPDAG